MSNSREKINPEKKPLEELTIIISEDGVQRKVPALSSHFAGDRPMTSFFVPPSTKDNGSFDIGAKEEWFHKMEIFKANLQWLLGLPHHRFWSQIVFGKKTWDSIISYLQEAYPFYAVHHLPDDYEIKERYNEISHLVFCVICRVATQQESEDAWIGKIKYGELLYDNAIISLPILFDFCVIFANNNKDEINRIISNIFSIQPLYKDDLDSSIQDIKKVLSTIEGKFLLSHIKPPDPPHDVGHNKMGISDIYDISFYILDTVATLYTFIDSYSEGAMILHLHRFEVSLAQFYDKVFPLLIKTLQELVSSSHPSYETLLFTTNQSRVYVIKLFYLIIQSCLNVIIENRCSYPEELLKYNAENFLNVFKDCLGSKVFMVDYQKTYPLEQDLDVLAQVYPEITNTEYNSIIDLLSTTFRPQGGKNISSGTGTQSHRNNPVSHQNGEAKLQPSSSAQNNLSNVEIDSLITEVKDILPHLGEGFILKCLEHYNYKSSDVINAVLENALPERLQLIDPDLPLIPPEPGVTEEKGVLSTRINVYDNDEFDIMTNDHIDTSRVHRGKRKEVKTEELLDDKSFREELRNQFSKFSIIETLDDVYDDEYDDTYDDTVVPLEEEGEAERKFVVPRVLQQQKDKESRNSRIDYEEEDDDEEDDEKNRRNGRNGFVPFVENPEVVRARREQARMSKAKIRPPPPQRDVVGAPRGQGQDSEVLRNRQKKNVHKGTHANHNRKKGAQYKRSQGFIPS